jgi:hypothetical protein
MSNANPKRKVRHFGKVRLNLRLPIDLDNWVKKYAKDTNTTVTQVVIQCFTDLRKKHEDGHVDQF